MIEDLRTDYKSDILMPVQQDKRTFNILDSNNNILYENVHIEDNSQYLQVGDEYGSDIINAQNTAINTLAKGTGLTFNTYQDYLDAKALGEVPVGSIIYIKEGNSTVITANQVTYNDSNVKLALDTLVNRGNGNTIKSKSTNITAGQTPSSNTWGNSYFGLTDASGTRVGYIQPMLMTDGTVDIRIKADNGKVKINNLDIEAWGTTTPLATVTQLNTQKNIDLTGYRFVILNVIVTNGIRVGNTIIPISSLPTTGSSAYEIGMYENSGTNTANLIYISKTWIKVTSAVTTGWTWGGVEVLGVK